MHPVQRILQVRLAGQHRPLLVAKDFGDNLLLVRSVTVLAQLLQMRKQLAVDET